LARHPGGVSDPALQKQFACVVIRGALRARFLLESAGLKRIPHTKSTKVTKDLTADCSDNADWIESLPGFGFESPVSRFGFRFPVSEIRCPSIRVIRVIRG